MQSSLPESSSRRPKCEQKILKCSKIAEKAFFDAIKKFSEIFIKSVDRCRAVLYNQVDWNSRDKDCEVKVA